VKPFQFSSLPRIIFRNGSLSDLPSLIKPFGTRVLIVTGKSSFMGSEKGAKFLSELRSIGVGYEIVSIESEPSPENVDMAAVVSRKSQPDVVVAIGGGSVMDAGKAIAAMIPAEGSVADYLEGVGTREHPGTKIPFIAVPTTSGTGSEATKNAVLSRTGRNGFKRSLRHDNFIPDIALIDPELTLGTPKKITAASGMDCFTQLTEAFLSAKSSSFTDAFAIEGLRAVERALLKAYTDGSDIDARSDMSFAALTSGICLANAGLGIVHGFASSIGGLYNIPHGVICGTLMAASNEINIKYLRKSGMNPAALYKYAMLGEIFTGKEGKGMEYLADAFIDYLHNLTGRLQLPALAKAGIRREDLPGIASATDGKNNPVKLSQDAVLEILEKRFE
jgi:alcohol dehydrogenase class IV